MAVVVDDHLLLGFLAGLQSEAVSEETQADIVYTTGRWYYRLARAVRANAGSGSLTRRLEALDPAGRERAVTALETLPQTVGLLSFRTVVPVMAALQLRRPFEHAERRGARSRSHRRWSDSHLGYFRTAACRGTGPRDRPSHRSVAVAACMAELIGVRLGAGTQLGTHHS